MKLTMMLIVMMIRLTTDDDNDNDNDNHNDNDDDDDGEGCPHPPTIYLGGLPTASQLVNHKLHTLPLLSMMMM